jgi:hypothetical protein
MPKTKIKMSSNRSFGLVFFIVFFIVSLWPLQDINTLDQIRIIPLCISLIFLLLGVINSKLLTPLNKLWFKFGMLLGGIIAPIVMGIIYFAVVTPTGLIMKMFGYDILNKKYDKNKKTYWINKKKENSSMRKQF